MQAMTQVHAEYERIFDAFDAAGVAWCLLRAGEPLHALQKDLDLLVALDRRTEALAALRELGFLVLRDSFHNPGKSVLVRWTGSELVTLDVHFECVIAGFEYLDGSGVLARSTSTNGARFPCDADLYVILLLHDLIGKGGVQAKYAAQLRRLVPSLTGSDAESDLRQRGIARLVPADSRALDPVLERAEVAAAAGAAIRKALTRSSVKTLWRRVTRPVKRLLRRPNRGASIAFLGPDGSGKTTTMQEFESLARENLGARTKTIYMGPWGHYQLGFTKKMRHPVPSTMRELADERRRCLREGDRKPSTMRAIAIEWKRLRDRPGGTDAPDREFHRSTTYPWLAYRYLVGHVRYSLFLVTLWIELMYRYQQVWRAKRWGYIVICDRWAFDLVSGAMHGITPRSRWMRYLFCALYPEPDVAVLLFNDAETLAARKDDLDLPTMRQMLALYDTISHRWGLLRIRTDVPPADVARRVLTESFPTIVAKRRT